MKKKISALLLTAVMLLMLMPVEVFAVGEKHNIVNGTPVADRNANGGYIAVQSEAEAGEVVNISVIPNEGFKVKKVIYKKAADQNAVLSPGGLLDSLPSIPASDQTEGGGAPEVLPPVSEDTLTPLPDLLFEPNDVPDRNFVEITGNDSASYSFSMPDYDVLLMAEFEAVDHDWTDWEQFGTGKYTFSLLVAQPGSAEFNTYIRSDRNQPTRRQILVKDWGNPLFGTNADLILDWNTATNAVDLSPTSTGFSFNRQYYLMVSDQMHALGSGVPCSYDPDTGIFTLNIVYYESPYIYGLGTETLRVKAGSALPNDADEDDFSATFTDEETELIFTDGAALLNSDRSDKKMTALYIGIEKGVDEIPAGEYVFNKTGAPGTVLASSGVVNGNKLTYSFSGNRGESGMITTPIWFMVNGKVTVSYAGNEMTVVIDAENSCGKNIDVTIKKIMPATHAVIDGTVSENGAIQIDKTRAAENYIVTLTAAPADGYRMKADTLKAVYNDGTGMKELPLTQDPSENRIYTFTMPAADVTVSAEFEEADNSFKAVLDQETGVLTFFYDKLSHAGTEKIIFDELTENAELPSDWAYDVVRTDVKSVVIDESCSDYNGLQSTAYMFSSMFYAESIIGAEYLNTGNVTDMKSMFYAFSFVADSDLETVPDVSGWDTGKVTDMSSMFSYYGYTSEKLASVPDVSNWNTGSVTDMKQMFNGYGNSSSVLDEVPNVSGWDTEKVTDISQMFQYYGDDSEMLTDVPDVGAWNIANVTNFFNLFNSFASTSEKLNFVLDLRNWDLKNAENLNNMFVNAGTAAEEWTVRIPYSTNGLDNSPEIWYGKDDSVSVVPAEERQFTLIYPVRIMESITNGRVEVSKNSEEAGMTVALTVTPNKNYRLKENSLIAVYNDGTGDKTVPLSQDPSDTTKYTFTMPAYPVTVQAAFSRVEEWDIPDTGDVKHAGPWLAFMGLTLTGILSCVLIFKKRKDTK